MRAAFLVPLLVASSCASAVPVQAPEGREPTPPARGFEVEHWGAMRTVLRDGETQGRVRLTDAVGPRTLAVGALEGLAAEITVVDGVVHLAEVVQGDALSVRAAREGEQATLLLKADVAGWSEHLLLPVASPAELEARVFEVAVAQGIDVADPFPFKVVGTASQLQLHVLDHSCPIAAPDGPAPWTFEAQGQAVVLAGFHAANAAGVLTHHGQSSHVHAIVDAGRVSGHLDHVELASGARLYLPVP